MRYEFMAPCHFGLEAATKREITALGLEITGVTDGRVSFSGDEHAMARANVFLRTTERVLLKAGEFEARTWDELFEETYALPWEFYIPKGGHVWVTKANSVKSKLFSPRDFQTIIQKAVIRRLQDAWNMEGRYLPMDGPDYALRVSAVKDVITIGIDTSGESLHKRGYRVNTVKAPITETLAAALLMMTPWHKDRILVDPFCGSGTFLIEAAMMAADLAPGMERNFAATRWANIAPKQVWYDAYDEARDRAASCDRAALREMTDLQGFDIDPEAIEAAVKNAENAGVRDLIHFQVRDVKELNHRKKYGFIITNPPYGERLSDEEELPGLYRTLGERYAALDDWSMYVISGWDRAEQYIGRKADKNRKIYNGMMKTYFYSWLGPKPPKREADAR